jgi:hypothetical protein
MHGRTARASLDECAAGNDAFIEHPTGVPGVRAFSSLWAIAVGVGQGCVRVRVAPVASRPAVMTTSPPATGQRPARPGPRRGML